MNMKRSSILSNYSQNEHNYSLMFDWLIDRYSYFAQRKHSTWKKEELPPASNACAERLHFYASRSTFPLKTWANICGILLFYISSLCVIYILHLHFHGSLVHSLINHHRPPHDLKRDEGLRNLRGSSPFSWLDGTIYLFLSFGIISLTLLSVIIYILITLSHERDIPCGIADTLWL